MHGVLLMLKWPADSWDSLPLVHKHACMQAIKFNCIIFAGAVALTSGFTNGVGQIWLDQVACVGTETRLIDCRANPLGNHDCSHIEDAGVRCQIGTSLVSPTAVVAVLIVLPSYCCCGCANGVTILLLLWLC
jgi:hypothetical protein